MTRGAGGKNAWVAAILSASLFLSGYSFFSWMYQWHRVAAWLSVTGLGLLGILVWWVLLRQQPKTKLVIHSANYAAVDGSGTKYDVTEFMRQIITGDSLVLDIENHNFVIGNRNFVPQDPKPYIQKRLQVTYSYNGEASLPIERKEHSRLVLPEDTEVQRAHDHLKMLYLQENKERTKYQTDYATAATRVRELESKLTPSDLAARAFDLARRFKLESQEFRTQNTAPRPPSVLGLQSNREYSQSVEVWNAWKAKAIGWYRSKFMAELQQMRDELAAEGLSDSRLDYAIQPEPAIDPEHTNSIVQQLRFLAIQLEDDPKERMSPLKPRTL